MHIVKEDLAQLESNPAPIQELNLVKKRPVWLMVLAAFLILTGIGAASATYWYHKNIDASNFKPVSLTAKEQTVFEEKVSVLSGSPQVSDPSKTIILNEKEVNAFLAQQGWGEKLKVHIGKDKISAAVLAPMDEEVPLLGGRTLRVNVAFHAIPSANKKISFSLADVNVGGISLPNAWLGNLKGIDLLNQLHDDSSPLVSTISAGIQELQLQQGELRILLND